ncbi:choice-of-anchor Q domain-containing protein [Cohnella sp. 56]|uniref:choice-of-anchor Q domain-containing protein n=1 Tax=Cohnella sp. 56 TaxID=3113722 RepID=UPI0030E933C0
MGKSKQRYIAVWVAAVMMLCALVGSWGPAPRAYASGTTYYVDSAAGNDANSGTSTSQPWRTLTKVNGTVFNPGDRILFKSGSVWNGQLWPKGSGTAGSPIAVDRYGTGAKPQINGQGLVQETIRLYNQEYWEISNLDITNLGASRELRRAVWLEAHDAGVIHHIHLLNLDIHDVNSTLGKWDYVGGGIIVRVTGGAVQTKFDDVLLQGNSFRAVDHTGIFIQSDWHNRGVRTDGTGPWYGMTNIVIRGNSLQGIGADGIVVCDSAGPLIESNVVSNANRRAEGAHAANWNINTDDAVFQFNESYQTRTQNDGQGFDADGLSKRTVYQYNYSHDNEGGFMLICNYTGADSFNDDGIIRYNISQNDRTVLFQLVGRNRNFQIYNNTLYVGSGLDTAFVKDWGDTSTGDSSAQFYNNIVYNRGSSLTYSSPITSIGFDYNLFYGNHDPSEPSDPHKLTSDPKLVAPGTGGIGVNTVNGYKLQASSPAINSGKTIAGNGGRDYGGQTVPYSGGTADRGAFEYQGAPSPAAAPAAGTQWRASLGFSGTQGQDGWYYKQWDGSAYTNMTWDAAGKVWVGSQPYAIVTPIAQHPDAGHDTVRAWVAPAAGTITIGGLVAKQSVGGGDGVIASIRRNGTLLWGGQAIAYDNANGYSTYLTTTVAAGDTIYFQVNRGAANDWYDLVYWDPIITWGDRTTWRASEGFGSKQGQDQWSYKQWNGSALSNMSWDNARGVWQGTQSYAVITGLTQHPETGKDAVRVWTAPKAGTVKITGQVRKDNTGGGDGVVASIWKNGTVIWDIHTIAYNDFIGYSHDVTTTVAAGDTIGFYVYQNTASDYYDNTNWDPVIAYQ